MLLLICLHSQIQLPSSLLKKITAWPKIPDVLKNSKKTLEVPWQAGELKKELHSNCTSNAVTWVGNNQPVLSGANRPHTLHITLCSKNIFWKTQKIWTTLVPTLKPDDLSTEHLTSKRACHSCSWSLLRYTSVFTATPLSLLILTSRYPSESCSRKSNHKVSYHNC